MVVELEMPTPCGGCGEIHDLNNMWSMPDGRVVCRSCRDDASTDDE